MIKHISVKKLRSNLANVLEEVRTRLDRYIISKRGEPEAVLMCIDDYEGWLETLEIMSSKKTMDDIKRAEKELAAEKVCSFEDVFGKNKNKLKKASR